MGRVFVGVGWLTSPRLTPEGRRRILVAMKEFNADKLIGQPPKNLREAEEDVFFGTKREQSKELTKEELAEWVNHMTMAMYRGDVEKVAKDALFLIKTKQKVDLYHRINTKSLSTNWVAEAERTIRKSSAEGHYYGQGIYWGVNEPYHWIQEHELGECYIVRDVPITDVFLAYCSGQVMALMPVHRLSGAVEEDASSKATLSSFLEDTEIVQRASGGKVLVFRDDVPDVRPLYSSEAGYLQKAEDPHEHEDEGQESGRYIEMKPWPTDPQDLAWWKSLVPSGSEWETQRFPDTKTLDEIHKALGIEAVEYVENDADLEEPFLRIYVREKRPLLCMSVAAAARLPELVFGDNPNIKKMQEEAGKRGALMSLKDWKARRSVMEKPR